MLMESITVDNDLKESRKLYDEEIKLIQENVTDS